MHIQLGLLPIPPAVHGLVQSGADRRVDIEDFVAAIFQGRTLDDDLVPTAHFVLGFIHRLPGLRRGDVITNARAGTRPYWAEGAVTWVRSKQRSGFRKLRIREAAPPPGQDVVNHPFDIKGPRWVYQRWWSSIAAVAAHVRIIEGAARSRITLPECSPAPWLADWRADTFTAGMVREMQSGKWLTDEFSDGF